MWEKGDKNPKKGYLKGGTKKRQKRSPEKSQKTSKTMKKGEKKDEHV